MCYIHCTFAPNRIKFLFWLKLELQPQLQMLDAQIRMLVSRLILCSTFLLFNRLAMIIIIIMSLVSGIVPAMLQAHRLMMERTANENDQSNISKFMVSFMPTIWYIAFLYCIARCTSNHIHTIYIYILIYIYIDI